MTAGRRQRPPSTLGCYRIVCVPRAVALQPSQQTKYPPLHRQKLTPLLNRSQQAVIASFYIPNLHPHDNLPRYCPSTAIYPTLYLTDDEAFGRETTSVMIPRQQRVNIRQLVVRTDEIRLNSPYKKRQGRTNRHCFRIQGYLWEENISRVLDQRPKSLHLFDGFPRCVPPQKVSNIHR